MIAPLSRKFIMAQKTYYWEIKPLKAFGRTKEGRELLKPKT
jgi:hypothetical protein